MNKVQSIAVAAAMLLAIVGCRGNAFSNLSSAPSGNASSGASATAWTPIKDVKVIVAYRHGSGTDTSARLLLANAKKYVGQSLVVENLEGADGKIGYTALARAKPDGYTIGFINMPTFTTLALESDSPFSIKSVVPICNHLFEPSAVVVKQDSPYNTLQDLIDACEAGELKCSTNGNMASNHTGAQIFAKAAGFDYKAVPYGGTADQLMALSQDEVEFSVPKVGDVASMVTGDNAELRMLAVFSENRVEQYPDVPTMKELGLIDTWYGSARALVAPANTPQAIIDFYAEAFKKAMEDQKCITDHEAAGLSMTYMDPDALTDLLTAQDTFCRDIVVTLYQD
ncbi:tripartite tricarboxylate transporter substrate binding protein [Oscillospiraceae bacterium LTW-04]|nr:tripartite tricarboxylate transporter substrate binding protein [Oscillospiraceae bacterium MB24-C1]